MDQSLNPLGCRASTIINWGFCCFNEPCNMQKRCSLFIYSFTYFKST